VAKVVALLVIWGLATAAGLWFAWQTHVGPVIYAFSVRHGIHLGDVVAFVVAYAWAVVLTIGVVGTPPSPRQ
jgi:hypothetical protein